MTLSDNVTFCEQEACGNIRKGVTLMYSNVSDPPCAGFRGARCESRTGGHFNVIVVMYRMSLVLNAVVMVPHVYFIRRVSGADAVGWAVVYREAVPPLARGTSRITRLTCSENYMVACR